MPRVSNRARSAKNLSAKVQRAIRVVFTPIKRVASSIADLVVEGDATDYILERQLEVIATALERDPSALSGYLKTIGKSMDSLGSTLRRAWLEGDVPECGYELKVRAAEALGLWSIAVREPRQTVVKRLASKRYEHRMWAARAVRASGWRDARTLLAPLARDPFTDDNGFHLVREAAGFND